MLLTQARGKAFVVQTNDSLIRSAVSYYDQTDDLSKRALSHYYFGCVNRDSKQCREALAQFFMAKDLAVLAKEERLLEEIYRSIGYLYHSHHLNEQADSSFRLAQRIPIRLHSLSSQAEMVWQRGEILMDKGADSYPEAETLFQEALTIADQLACSQLRRSIYSSLTLLYQRMGNREKALTYALLNLQQQEDAPSCYKAYQLLGSAYCALSKYDSAFYYLHKALPTTDYDVKLNIYSCLADIARSRGDFESAVELEHLHSAYSDSLRLSNHAIGLVRAEKEMLLDQQKKEHNKHLTHFQIYLYLFFGATLLAVALLFKRFYKKTVRLQQEKELVLEKQGQMSLRQQQIQEMLLQKETELAELQTLLEHENADKQQKHLLHKELEGLHLERTILLQENYMHTAVVVKMKSIVSAHKLCGKSKEILLEEDWQQLVLETDQRWDNITLKLQAKYDLSPDEIHLCCLFLTDFPVNAFGFLLGCTRDAIYKKADRIVEQRMGYPHKTVVLRDVLRNFK